MADSSDAIQRARDIAARLRGGFGDGPDASAAPEPKRQKRSGFSDGPGPGGETFGGNRGGFSDGAKSTAAAAAMAAVAALRQARGLAASGAPAPEAAEPEARPSRFQYDPSMPGPLLQLHVAMCLRAMPRRTSKIFVPNEPGTNFMGLLLGPRGATLKEMQEASGAKIIIRGVGSHRDGGSRSHQSEAHADDALPLHVSIEGAEDAVAKAEKVINAMLFDPASRAALKAKQLNALGAGAGDATGHSAVPEGGEGWMVVPQAPRPGETTYEARVPDAMVGLVIGKGGETLKRLTAETGVRVQIARDPEPAEASAAPGAPRTRRIAFTGTAGGIEAAQKDLDAMLRSRFAGPGGPGACTASVVVANDKVGLVIGRGGITIKGIQERTGANVRIPQGPDEGDATRRTLTVTGPTDDSVSAASHEIEILVSADPRDFVATAADPVFGPPQIVPVPEGCVGLIIGRGGETISRLQAGTGAKIQIPNEAAPGVHPPSRHIEVSGTPDARSRAYYEIAALVSQHESRNPAPATGMIDPYAQQAYDPYAAAQHPPEALAPDAYHADFWNYAGWYGEEAARATYGAYAPPPGTAPPPPPPPAVAEPPPPGAEPQPAPPGV